MKKSFAVILAMGAATFQAASADIAQAQTVIPAQAVAPAFNWTGFYAGANLGAA
jgi:hypothetical protein